MSRFLRGFSAIIYATPETSAQKPPLHQALAQPTLQAFTRGDEMRVLLFALVVVAVAWASEVAAEDILPPCCQTPPVIEFLRERPADEAEPAFRRVFTARLITLPYEEVEVERGAIIGACSESCPANYRWAQSLIDGELKRRRTAAGQFFDGPPCCSSRSEELASRPSGTRPKTLRPSLPGPRSNASINSEEFAHRFLLSLKAWKGLLDTIPVWVDGQLKGASPQQLRNFVEVIDGRCSERSHCSPAMRIAREYLAHRVQDYQRDEDRRAQLHDLQVMAQATVKAAIIGAVTTLLIGMMTVCFGVFQSRRADRRLIAALDRIDASLAVLMRAAQPAKPQRQLKARSRSRKAIPKQ